MSVADRVNAWLRGPRAVVLAALAGLALLIVVAAGSDPEADRWIGTEHLRVASLTLFGLVVVASLALTIFVVPTRGPVSAAGRPKRRVWVVWAFAAILMLVVVVFDPSPPEDDAVAPEDEEQVVGAPSRAADDNGDGVSIDRTVDRTDLMVFAAALGLVGAAVVWSRRRSRADGLRNLGEGAALAADLAPVLDRASRELAHGEDPRSAVLAAYAILEVALSDRGQPREPFETPTEHLSRVLAALPVDDAPLIELGALYEVARYSRHAVTVADQRRAAAALNDSRTALEAHEVIA